MKTKTTFVEEAQAKYPNLNYSGTKYVNKRTKIKFLCDVHGIVEQLPANHLKIGCPHCSRGSDNTHSFINKAREAGWHYDYSETVFTSNKKNVVYNCPDHGRQEQLPKSLLKNGCMECKNGKKFVYKHTKESILRKCLEQHGEKYEYPELEFGSGFKVDYFENVHQKMKIICPIHGEFEQQIWAHATGQGCRECGYANRQTKNQYSET